MCGETEETLTNSLAARQWMMNAGAADADLDKHFLAITSNLEAAAEFGISPENCLPMWDWVGGRYSVWSAIGLSCAIAVGWENFQAFLEGAATMDKHFAEAPLADNLPVLMGLLEVWYVNFFGAVFPQLVETSEALRISTGYPHSALAFYYLMLISLWLAAGIWQQIRYKAGWRRLFPGELV